MGNQESLTQSLQDFKTNFAKGAPKEVQALMQSALEELVASKTGEGVLKVGDQFPTFKLKNKDRNDKSFDELFGDQEHLIISFYRGGWCPYCNLELKALQDNLEAFKATGANLVAITSERPDHSSETANKNDLKFEVLTDEGSALSKKLGIAFELPDSIKPLYEKFGLDIVKHNGDYTLQVPATLVVNKSGQILFSFLDVDYTKRLDPAEILNFLKKH